MCRAPADFQACSLEKVGGGSGRPHDPPGKAPCRHIDEDVITSSVHDALKLRGPKVSITSLREKVWCRIDSTPTHSQKNNRVNKHTIYLKKSFF